ncbi:CBS domain-containing protein [Bacteroidetes/Chlorobi group bacterium ChocPot_Mid]|jgi:CBS domain-containing protein|nr:MAG: CBS domain-containing protein [Bacteroidetes/Chlorobi group bacterium ChocPot_Mid]
MKVKDILKNKGPEVFTISEEKTVADALKILVSNNIGVLIVLNNDAKISGIFSERDVVKNAYSNPEEFINYKIKDIMSTNIIFVEPEDDIEYIESVMTNNHIRHLPVVSNKILVGLISIGDIVKSSRTITQTENKYLMDYISGNLVI